MVGPKISSPCWAAAIDPVWNDRAAGMLARADEAATPEEMRDLARRPTLTRGQLAALIGTRLPAVLASAPRRTPPVATDVRGHWAAMWILAVTQAGVMEVFPNHTFQPGATVRRAELAQSASALAVHQALQRKPIATSAALVKATRLTPATVNKSLAHLERIGIVGEVTNGQRGRVFSYRKYVEELAAELEEPA